MDHDHNYGVSPGPERPQRRRRLLQALAVGGVSAAALPEKWVKPVIDAVIVPAHAAGSVVQVTGIYSNEGLGLGSASSYLERFAGFLVPSAHAQSSGSFFGGNCVSFDFTNNPSVTVYLYQTNGSGYSVETTVQPSNAVANVTIRSYVFSGLTVSPTRLDGFVQLSGSNALPEAFSFGPGVSCEK